MLTKLEGIGTFKLCLEIDYHRIVCLFYGGLIVTCSSLTLICIPYTFKSSYCVPSRYSHQQKHCRLVKRFLKFGVHSLLNQNTIHNIFQL